MPAPPALAPDGLRTSGVSRLLGAAGDYPLPAVAIAVALTAAVFVADIMTPLGVTVWAFYFVPFLLLVLAAPRYLAAYVIAFAGLASAGLFFSQPGGRLDLLDGFINRGMFAVSLALVAGLTFLLNEQRAGLAAENERRRRAERTVQESEERLRVALEAADLGTWDLDLTTDVAVRSLRHDQILGYRELQPEWGLEIALAHMVPEDRPVVVDAHARARETGVLRHEARVIWPDGTLHWIEANGRVHYDPDGRPVRIVGVVAEVTERKRAEVALAADLAALTRMHALSARLLEGEGIESLLDEIMATAVAIMGADKGTLQLVEEGSLRIVASRGHDAPFLAFFASAESRASACGLAMAERDRVIVPEVEESPLFAGTPSLRVMREAGVRAVQSTPLVSRTGELLGVLTTQWARPHVPDEHDLWRLDLLARQAADLIERVRAEAALRAYAEDLRRSNEDLERFAYVSSHDLQEPLRSIVSFSQLLERRYRGKLDTDADEYIGFIVEGGNRMQTLIQDLLAYSRVNTKAQELRPTDAEAVMAAVERGLDLQLREAGAIVTHDPLPMVLADPLQIELVFMNLVSNAVKFRKPEVPLRVHVGARRTDGFWEFSVSDNGIGIEPEYHDRIFVIFQRLHTKDAYPGTGIGLAIVKRIIDRHGGTVRVESTPGAGSTFYFTLPAA